jgi:predicted NAD/FAD-binding protein
MEKKQSIKVAVIGSGLAGLTAAYLLSNQVPHKEVEVHVFERNKSVGMDASSISTGTDNKQRIDVIIEIQSISLNNTQHCLTVIFINTPLSGTYAIVYVW